MFRRKENEYEKIIRTHSDEIMRLEQARHEAVMENIELKGEISMLKNEIDHLKKMEKLYKMQIKILEDKEKHEEVFDPDKRVKPKMED